MRVAAPPLPLPLLCCVVCWCQHATCCSHPATPPPHQSWHRGLTAPPLLSSPLSVTAHIPSAAAAAGGRLPDIHPHVMMMMTRRCVPLCAPHEVLMHGEHSGHCTCCNLAEQRCVCACVMPCTVWLYECPPPFSTSPSSHQPHSPIGLFLLLLLLTFSLLSLACSACVCPVACAVWGCQLTPASPACSSLLPHPRALCLPPPSPLPVQPGNSGDFSPSLRSLAARFPLATIAGVWQCIAEA